MFGLFGGGKTNGISNDQIKQVAKAIVNSLNKSNNTNTGAAARRAAAANAVNMLYGFRKEAKAAANAAKAAAAAAPKTSLGNKISGAGRYLGAAAGRAGTAISSAAGSAGTYLSNKATRFGNRTTRSSSAINTRAKLILSRYPAGKTINNLLNNANSTITVNERRILNSARKQNAIEQLKMFNLSTVPNVEQANTARQAKVNQLKKIKNVNWNSVNDKKLSVDQKLVLNAIKANAEKVKQEQKAAANAAALKIIKELQINNTGNNAAKNVAINAAIKNLNKKINWAAVKKNAVNNQGAFVLSPIQIRALEKLQLPKENNRSKTQKALNATRAGLARAGGAIGGAFSKLGQGFRKKPVGN
jgi:hypothetical protein